MPQAHHRFSVVKRFKSWHLLLTVWDRSTTWNDTKLISLFSIWNMKFYRICTFCIYLWSFLKLMFYTVEVEPYLFLNNSFVHVQSHIINVYTVVGGTQRLYSVKLSVQKSKYCLRFSITWGLLKISRWPFHSCTVFEAYLINSLWISDVQFSHFTSQVRLFVIEKRKPKIFGLKNRGERNQKMSHFRNTSNCI